MQQALDSNTLDRLISLGRKQGYLTNQDLEANLPIDSMTAEEIALIVVHLEETGIPVELDDSLISSNPKPSLPPAKSAEIIPFPGRSAAPNAERRKAPLQTGAPLQPGIAKAEIQAGDKAAAHWAVAIAGLLVLVILVGLVFLTAI
jgi:hypothetical protein